MKFFWTACLSVGLVLQAGAQTGFDPAYVPLKSMSKVQDKDFYLFTLLETPVCKAALEKDVYLVQKAGSLREQVARLGTQGNTREVFRSLAWSPDDIDSVSAALEAVFSQDHEAARFLVNQMRASGYWIRYKKDSDTALLRKAWADAAEWENRIIRNYISNKGFRYPAIDSATFAPGGPEGGEMLMETGMMLWHKKETLTLFFQPSLELSLGILFVNGRDEAARFEPMDSSNRSAYERIPAIHWADYPYSFILLPGEGPENDQPISPVGQLRCQLGAEQYNKHLAPFIVVSGGFVHPFQTPYCEAQQMKNYLVKVLGIPEDAVILEPHARHTTTNIRNANRILFRKGMPADKRVLCTSTSGQIAYILTPLFSIRCKMEMGYAPYREMQRIDAFNLSYLPEAISLQMDAVDPLDP